MAAVPLAPRSATVPPAPPPLHHHAAYCGGAVRRQARRHQAVARRPAATQEVVPAVAQPAPVQQGGPHAVSSASSKEEGLLADYFAALKVYRAMMKELGPQATQAARALSSSTSSNMESVAMKQQRLVQAAAACGVAPEALAELVGLRKMLLRELPRLQAAAAGHPAHAAGEAAPSSVQSWLRTKQYKQRAERRSSSSSSSSSSNGSSDSSSTVPPKQQQPQQQQPEASSAEELAVAAQLSGAPSRLRAAAMAAAAYKQRAAAGAKGAAAGVTGSKAGGAAGGVQHESTGKTQPPGAVEVGNAAYVEAAPRRSRASEEEASFLVCP